MWMSTAFGRRPRAWALSALLWGACSEEAAPAEVDEGVVSCERDDSQGPETAVELSGEVTGFVCPPQDEDWYRFELGQDARLFEIALSMETPRSVVDPTYAVWSLDGDGAPDTVVAAPDPDDIGQALSRVHCLEPGAYMVAVRDDGDDDDDVRNRYDLSIVTSAEPDAQEPNGDEGQATALSPNNPVTGYVACEGDEDWYAIQVPDGSVLSLSLNSEAANYQPHLRLLDSAGQLVIEDFALAAPSQGAAIAFNRTLAQGGVYHVVVSDDDGDDGDPAVAYTLLAAFTSDTDANEPNDHPREATALAEVEQACGADWSQAFTATGSISAAGDNDWFRLPATGCTGGILEAELEFDTSSLSATEAWQSQAQLQASITLVRPDPSGGCTEDLACRTLSIPCDQESGTWDCAGFFNSCASDGLCTGATVCLPNGQCGANQTQRVYRSAAIPNPITTPPPLPNRAYMTAPMLDGGDVWLRVSDFQSDAGNPDISYTLSVRIRRDTDPQDATDTPNNLYGNTLTNDNLPVSESQSVAVTVPVHDCAAGDCCNGSTWVEGAISYENDLDWFTYGHPCLDGEGMPTDCLLRVHYEADAGAVDNAFFLYQGRNLFFSFGLDGNGTFGDDECLYAFSGHNNPYYVLVRDTIGTGLFEGRDSNPDQRYRFCIEKYADGCGAPCTVAPNGECTSD